MNIMAFEGFYFIGDIWKVSIIPQKIHAFLNWKKKKKEKKALHTEQLIAVYWLDQKEKCFMM